MICPVWLCFDWSMGCISLIKLNSVPKDPRLFIVFGFWTILVLVSYKMMFSRNYDQKYVLFVIKFNNCLILKMICICIYINFFQTNTNWIFIRFIIVSACFKFNVYCWFCYCRASSILAFRRFHYNCCLRYKKIVFKFFCSKSKIIYYLPINLSC